MIGCAEAHIRAALTVSQFAQNSSETLGALAENYLKRSWQVINFATLQLVEQSIFL